MKTFDPETGAVISPFTHPELVGMGLSPDEAAFIIWGGPSVPGQRQAVRLVSVDGFRVRFEEVEQ